MLQTIRLRFGPFGPGTHTEFRTSPMTVFVGPNNSGKSLALRELAELCRNGPYAEAHIIESVRLALPTPDEAIVALGANQVRPSPQALAPGHCYLRYFTLDGRVEDSIIDTNKLHAEIANAHAAYTGPQLSPPIAAQIYEAVVRPRTVILDGKARLQLLDSRPVGDLQAPPVNHLMALFQDDAKRAKVREVVRDAFGQYFVLDPTGMDKLRVRMAPRAPNDPTEERNWDERSRAFHAAATPIDQFSDGCEGVRRPYHGVVERRLPGNAR